MIFSLKLKNRLLELGKKVLLLSNYENAEIFDAININKLIYNKNLSKVYNAIENLSNEIKCDGDTMVIVSISHQDDITKEQYDYYLNMFLKILISSVEIKAAINLIPYNFYKKINLNRIENDSIFVEYGIISNLYVLMEEILTNGINGGRELGYVDISKNRHFNKELTNKIIYNDEYAIDKILNFISNSKKTDTELKEIL